MRYSHARGRRVLSGLRPVNENARVRRAAGGVLLFLPAFRSSSFVRFHAWQSIFLWGVFFLASLIGILLSNIAAAIVLLLLGILGSLAMFFLWIVLSLKAWQGERLELPLFGLLAERLS